MKNYIIFILLSLFAIILNPLYTNAKGNPVLTEDEKNSLIDMRAEEKLAHDVYTALFEKYEMKIFSNIARSEKRHVEAIQNLLDEYKIDASLISEPGKFEDSQFQKLYDDLLAQGMESLEDAYRTAMMIEDLDISDLDKLITETKNEDLKIVFNNLNQASENHMRSFHSHLSDLKVDYAPKYLSQQRFDEIIVLNAPEVNKKGRKSKGNRGCGKSFKSNKKESCMAKGNGKGGSCRGSESKGKRSCRR